MTGEQPPSRPGPAAKKTKTKKKAQAKRPTRRLSLPSRVRASFRRGTDRVLSMDRVWLLLFVGLTILMLGSQRCGVDYGDYRVGDIADEDIRARYDVDVPDSQLTEVRREEAREAVADIYVHDTERTARLLRAFVDVFRRGRAADPAERVGARPPIVSEAAWAALGRHEFSDQLEGELAGIIRTTMRQLIVGNRTLIPEGSITVVRIPGGRQDTLESAAGIVDLTEARSQVRRAVEGAGLPRLDRGPIADFAASFIDANLSFDPERTRQRKEEQAAAVAPVLVRVGAGEFLLRRGDTVTDETRARLDAARRASRGRFGLFDLAGLIATLTLLALFLYRYAAFHQRHFRKLRHLHALLVIVQLSMLLISKATLWLAGKVISGLGPPFDDLRLYHYLIPIGAGTIVVALLTNSRIAMVHAAFAALLYGAVAGWDGFAITWGLIVQWAGVYAVSTYKDRAALLRAGLVVGGAGALMALALEALRGTLDPFDHSLYAAGLAFVGGAVGVGLLVSFVLPLLEGMFHVLTDVRLLELSNSDHPLLSELAVKAPGTYNHSLVVGTLAEEGARAIGANALFCRVAAAYHDIGKMLKPDYYVENQRGANPHDKLSPSMSALVIAAHVKDGVKMAREAGLPEQIIDIIPQHHGTRMMTYFYEKARKGVDPSLGRVKEEDFRYPGPKPQTKEAAIFMLADGVEAAARTLDEPSPNRLREMIRQVGSAIVLDGQLDECDLTFTDLERIQGAFLRFLVSMHHHRVDYPGFDFKKAREEDAGVAETTSLDVARES